MNTTMHDTTLSWQDCPVCSRLQRELEQARVERERAWSVLSGVDLHFSEAMDNGRAYIGTTEWQRWRDLLDSLTLQDDLAAKHLQATLAAWGESIREHATPQPMENEETDDGTGEAPTTAQDDGMPCMVDLGCDHCAACENGHEKDDDGEADEVGKNGEAPAAYVTVACMSLTEYRHSIRQAVVAALADAADELENYGRAVTDCRLRTAGSDRQRQRAKGRRRQLKSDLEFLDMYIEALQADDGCKPRPKEMTSDVRAEEETTVEGVLFTAYRQLTRLMADAPDNLTEINEACADIDMLLFNLGYIDAGGRRINKTRESDHDAANGEGQAGR